MIPVRQRIQLNVTGMTCGMCSAHIERKLNKIDGVRAAVDFPTMTATIDAAPDVDVATLCEVVENAGYHAELRSQHPLTDDDPAIVSGPLQRSLAATTRFLRRLGGAGGPRNRQETPTPGCATIDT